MSDINYRALNEVIDDVGNEAAETGAKAAINFGQAVTKIAARLQEDFGRGPDACFDMADALVSGFFDKSAAAVGRSPIELMSVSSPANITEFLYPQIKASLEFRQRSIDAEAARKHQALVEVGAAPVSRPAPLVD